MIVSSVASSIIACTFIILKEFRLLVGGEVEVAECPVVLVSGCLEDTREDTMDEYTEHNTHHIFIKGRTPFFSFSR